MRMKNKMESKLRPLLVMRLQRVPFKVCWFDSMTLFEHPLKRITNDVKLEATSNCQASSGPFPSRPPKRDGFFRKEPQGAAVILWFVLNLVHFLSVNFVDWCKHTMSTRSFFCPSWAVFLLYPTGAVGSVFTSPDVLWLATQSSKATFLSFWILFCNVIYGRRAISLYVCGRWSNLPVPAESFLNLRSLKHLSEDDSAKCFYLALLPVITLGMFPNLETRLD